MPSILFIYNQLLIKNKITNDKKRTYLHKQRLKFTARGIELEKQTYKQYDKA